MHIWMLMHQFYQYQYLLMGCCICHRLSNSVSNTEKHIHHIPIPLQRYLLIMCTLANVLLCYYTSVKDFASVWLQGKILHLSTNEKFSEENTRTHFNHMPIPHQFTHKYKPSLSRWYCVAIHLQILLHQCHQYNYISWNVTIMIGWETC